LSPDFEAAGRDANLIVTTITMAAEKRRVRVAPEAQAIFCRCHHQPSRPPPAKIKPGSPAPAMGPGTASVLETLIVPAFSAADMKNILRKMS
jgi:hypothetical protein